MKSALILPALAVGFLLLACDGNTPPTEPEVATPVFHVGSPPGDNVPLIPYEAAVAADFPNTDGWVCARSLERPNNEGSQGRKVWNTPNDIFRDNDTQSAFDQGPILILESCRQTGNSDRSVYTWDLEHVCGCTTTSCGYTRDRWTGAGYGDRDECVADN